MNIELAESSLEDLKKQHKEAQDRLLILTGAIQGAEIILNSLKETNKEKSKK